MSRTTFPHSNVAFPGTAPVSHVEPKNLQAIQAEQVCRTPEELKAVRDGYEKRMKEAKK